MRPLHLTMSAFGPFAGVEEIDFSQLGDNPLFLINGATGSGKSTILDAICFALYGETTGNERQGKQMRCDQADPSTVTEVSLKFLLGEKKYRISRLPDQERPKARGEGVTEQKARAELYEIVGEEERLLAAPKITEVTRELVRLTGLSAEQFRQVMVLPQGRFRELLLAKSEDREAIFQQLFQTHVYSTLQTRLRDQSGILNSRINDIDKGQKTLLDLCNVESGEKLAEEIQSLESYLRELDVKRKKADSLLRKVQSEHHEAVLLEKSFVEQASAKARHELILNQKKDIDQAKENLQAAKEAREIEPLFLNSQKQEKLVKEANLEVNKRRTALDSAEKARQAAEADNQRIPALEKTHIDSNSKVIELENLRSRIQELHIAKKEFNEADRDLKASQNVTDELKKRIDQLATSLGNLEKDLQKKTAMIEELPDKKVKLEKMAEQSKTLSYIADLRTKIKGLTEEKAAIDKSLNQARQLNEEKNRKKDIYEQAWNHGQAAILAASLQDNEPCPVCGSTDHPQPATTSDELPSEVELKKVRQEADKQRTELENIERASLIKDREINEETRKLEEEEKKAKSHPNQTLEEVRQQYKLLNKEIKELQTVSDQLPGLRQNIDDSNITKKQLEQELAKHQKVVLDNTSRQATAAANLKNKESDLPEKYRQGDTLEQDISRASSERDQTRQAIDAIQKNHHEARENYITAEIELKSGLDNEQKVTIGYKEVTREWQTKLAQSRFENEQQFTQVCMDKTAEHHLEKRVRQYEDDLLLAKKDLEQKTVAIQGKTRPDTNTISEKLTQAEKNKQAFYTEYDKGNERKESLVKTLKKYNEESEKRKILETEYGVVGKLDEICNGKNAHNISLQRFVLSVLLDDVLTEASLRLHKMSKGRYQLYRKEEVTDKRSKSGLELQVEDAYTGKQRPAETLSGGESFLAALSLALGLSDVIQAYAGGIRLETLFIDEGFGSLDPESLDLAINTLLELRKSGRMIGLISHVEEMKRIIDTRIDVISSRGVSHTVLTGVRHQRIGLVCQF